jgi:hypothetical protein
MNTLQVQTQPKTTIEIKFRTNPKGKAEFYLIDYETQLLIRSKTSEYESFTYAEINKERKNPNTFTSASILTHIPKNYQLELTSALVNTCIAERDLQNTTHSFKLHKKGSKKKKVNLEQKQQSSNGEEEEEIYFDFKFKINKTEDIIKFVIADTMSDLVNNIHKPNFTSSKYQNINDGDFDDDVGERIERVREKIQFEPNYKFTISLNEPITIRGSEATKEVLMCDFMIYILCYGVTKEKNMNVVCFKMLLDYITEYLNKTLIGADYLQCTNTKVFKSYTGLIETPNKNYLDVVNGDKDGCNGLLNVFHRERYVKDLVPAVDGKTVVIKKEFQNFLLNNKRVKQEVITYDNTEILPIYNDFTENKEDWENCFERNFPHLTKYLKVLFNDCWSNFIKICAYKYQRPWELIQCSFIIWGVGGAGKSLLVDDILPSMFFKEKHCESKGYSDGDVNVKFNSYMEHSIILFLDEVSNFSELRNKLKVLTTATTINVENKGVDIRKVVNKNWTFCTSNDKGVSKLLADETENRRYVCIYLTKELKDTEIPISLKTQEGKELYSKTIEESKKTVAFLCNTNVFDFGDFGKDYKNFVPEPSLFSSINQVSQIKNNFKYSNIVPIFHMLLKQLKEEDNKVINIASSENLFSADEDKKKNSYMLNPLNIKSNNKDYVNFVGFDVDEVKRTIFLEAYVETVCSINGVSIQDYKKTKYAITSYKTLNENVLHKNNLESLFIDFQKYQEQNGFPTIKKEHHKLKYNKNEKRFVMYGDSYNQIKINIQNILNFLSDSVI